MSLPLVHRAPLSLAALAGAVLGLAAPADAQFSQTYGFQPIGCGGDAGTFEPAVSVFDHFAILGGVTCGIGGECFGTVHFHDRLPSGGWSGAQTLCADGELEFLTRGVAIGDGWAMTGGRAGATHVFQRTAATWAHTETVPTDQGADDSYLGLGNFLAMSGGRALRGSARATQPGTAYLLELGPGDAWSQVAEITPADGHAADLFGCAVAIDGDHAVVGAKHQGTDPLDPAVTPGAAYVFERQAGGGWLEVAKLEVDEPWIEFGRAVAIEGGRVAVGASTPAPPGIGAVFMFERLPDGTWMQTQRIQSLPSNNDFGAAVALSGDQLAVGAANDSQAGPGFGAVYVYERDALAVWSKVKTLFSNEGQADAGLGRAVAFDGGVIFALEESEQNAVVFESAFFPYGCGTNAPGSLTLLGGSSQLGDALTLGIDNPFATQEIGSLPILFVSIAPWLTYPCGLEVEGLGMAHASASGELLVGLAPSELAAALSGPAWTGPGIPAPIVLPIPDAPALAGLTVFVQGALYDPTLLGGIGSALTEALEIRLE